MTRKRSENKRAGRTDSVGIKPIRTRKDYDSALRQVESLMDARRNTARGDWLDVLVTLIESYEARHYPMENPDPVEAIKYAMEVKGLAPKDLAPMIGKPSRVYEVLNRKRPLTLPMIRRLHRELGIPAESLIG